MLLMIKQYDYEISAKFLRFFSATITAVAATFAGDFSLFIEIAFAIEEVTDRGGGWGAGEKGAGRGYSDFCLL